MEKKQKTLAIAGVGIASAAALGLAGAGLANAAAEPSASSVAGTYGQQLPGGGDTAPHGDRDGRMRDTGGTLTADAASKAVAAAQAGVDGGTVSGVRATASGTYVVDVTKSDGTHVHVLLDAKFAVTSVEKGAPGGPGGRGGHPDRDGVGDGDDDAPAGGTPPGGSGTGSSNPSDANGTSTTSAQTT